MSATLIGPARAQEEEADEKPPMDLPPITLEGLDEELLGPGEQLDAGSPGQDPLPLEVPDPELPGPISIGGETTAADFTPLGQRDWPSPLLIQGFARGGSFETITAGFDATHQLVTGGAFGRLAATASDGHLDNGAWSKVEARLGTAFEPVASAAFRSEIAHTARENHLPVNGFLTEGLASPFATQSLHQWGADARYRFEQEGFTAGVALEGSRGAFRQEPAARRQVIQLGMASIHFDLPLYAKLWNVETNLAFGGLNEDRPSGAERSRRRLLADLRARYAHPSGLGVEAGVSYHELGDVDVAGPIVRISHDFPPARRIWVALEPHFVEPDLLGFLADTPYAAGLVGQEPERATASVSGGLETTFGPGVDARVVASFRRSRGYLHADLVDPGRYGLDNLDRRLVFEIDGVAHCALGSDFVASLGYRMHEVEGRRIPYVVRNSAELSLKHDAASFDAGVAVRYIGAQWGGSGEGKLAQAWITSAEAAVPIAGLWQLSLGAHNLFDRAYRDFAEYASPGRRIEGGIRYSF